MVKQSEEEKQTHSEDTLHSLHSLQTQLQTITESITAGIESLSTQSSPSKVRKP